MTIINIPDDENFKYLLIHCSVYFIGMIPAVLYLPDLGVESGQGRNRGVLLLTIMGVVNTVVRPTIGFVCDKSWLDSVKAYVVIIAIGGVGFSFVGWWTEYGIMVMSVILLGAALGRFCF